MDIYTEHHPHHEIGPVEHLEYVGAQYYTTLLSRLTSHIKNEDVHVSNADKVKWEKAFLDINNLKDKVDSLTPSSNKDDIDLSDYATRKWVEDRNYVIKGQCPAWEDLSNLNKQLYALKEEIPSVDGLATEKYVDNAIAGIKPSGDQDMSGYATKQDVESLDDFVESATKGLQDYVNASKYMLPTASNTEKGGIKTGYKPSGDFNYPIRMDGEYAYVTVPFSTTGGGDIIVTSLYGIEIVSNTLKLQNNILTGSVVWKISEASGSSYSYIMPGAENISTYSQILPNNLRLSFTSNIQDGTYVGYAQNVQIDVADYVAITVEKNGSVVARQVIPIQNPGSNGEDGTTTVEYQSLEYPVIRLAGEYNFNTQYNDGTYNENGVYYIDVISCEGALYKAINPGGNRGGLTQRPYPERDQGWDEYWEPFSIYGQAAFDTLLANSAYITTLASKQIVVVDNQGVPVAGLLSNDATITTEHPDTHESETYSRNGVRIFAGETNGDITTAPFRVYDDGRLVATNANISGQVTVAYGNDATAQMALYTVSPGVIEPHIYMENTLGATSEMTANHLKYSKNTLGGEYRTTVQATGINTPSIGAAQGSFSDKLDVNGTVNIIGNLLLNGNQIGDYIDVDTTQNKPQIGDYLYSDWTFGSTAKAAYIGRCIATEDNSLDGNYVWAFSSDLAIAEWATEFGDVPTLDNIPADNPDGAKKDVQGWHNTKKLIDIQNTGVSTSIEFPAANLARQMFNGKGYLPAYGELWKYKDVITSIFGQGMFWSSTESARNQAWYLSTNGGAVGNDGKKYKCKVIGFYKSNPYPKPQNLWIDVTTAQSFYTFQIKNGMLQGIFHGQSADDLAKAGDKILQLNIDNGDSAAYYRTSDGQMIAW